MDNLQRTFELQIPCCCSQPAFCERYHGLPMPTAEFIALLPLFGSDDNSSWERGRLYEAYDTAPSGEERMEAFRRLTSPFNSY